MANERKYCFIIGPMFDVDFKVGSGRAKLTRVPRLKILKDYIIQPLLERVTQTPYQIHTPYDLPGGLIMNQVIAAIDRADLVIADMTTYNPNVFYEVALAHAIGVPTLMIRETPDPNVPERFPFDLSAYRYFDIHIYDPGRSKDILFSELQSLTRLIDDDNYDIFENPVTVYYNEPITSVSPGATLAQGYYRNFVQPAVNRLIAEIKITLPMPISFKSTGGLKTTRICSRLARHSKIVNI